MWQITDNKNWEALSRKFDWVADMQNTPQDAQHHAEGNVAIHTQMVLHELTQFPEFQVLTSQEQEIVWAAALMHDIEKRSTTLVEADGSITSKGHAKKGEFSVRTILYCHIETPFLIREQIAKLVRYHGLPLWIFEKSNPSKVLHQTSLEVNTQWLYLLAKADALGRLCADKDDLLYRVELFKELCIEHDCWGKAKAFSSHLARFEYFLKDDRSETYDVFDDYLFEVILLSGIAGAGKDTYIKKHLSGYQVICLDDFRRELKISPTDSKANGRVVQIAKEKAKEYLRNHTPFVWNATNITRQMREQLIDLFTTYKAKTTIIYLEVPYKQLIKQNNQREHVVPESAISRMIHKLEIPQMWETVEIIYEVVG